MAPLLKDDVIQFGKLFFETGCAAANNIGMWNPFFTFYFLYTGGFKVTAILDDEKKWTPAKFISFTWFGSKITGLKKAKARSYVTDTKKYFKSVNLYFEVADGDSHYLSEENIQKLLIGTGIALKEIDFENIYGGR